MKLTERKIETLAVEQGQKDRLIFDDTQRGLAVRVTVSGSRSYLCQYTLHGQKWRVPLGACSALSLSSAREAAASVMGDVAKGRNPAAERKEAAAAERAKRTRDRLTLRVLIDDWHRLHLASRRPSYAKEAVRALHSAFADHLDDAAEDLDRTAVVRALDCLTRRRRRKDGGGSAEKLTGAAMTGRTASYGRSAFGWAMKRVVVSINPFVDLPIDKGITKRERVLSDDEIGEIWRAAEKASAPYGAIIRLLILTGQRRGEVAGMKWSEIDDDLVTWTIPGERTKNGFTHIVPLSTGARATLKGLLPLDADASKRTVKERRANGALVLPGALGTPFAGWSKAKASLDKAIEDARAKATGSAGAIALVSWSVHDIRRTVATGLQRLGVRLEVTEAVLNHISGSRGGIAGVYQRHDWATEKCNALDAWANHVSSIVEGRVSSRNIVRLLGA